MKSSTARSPISFDVTVARLPKNGMPITIEANEGQRSALAEVHGLLSVERFRADLMITGWKSNGIKVEGRVKADIVQACVVTLDPVPESIDEEFSIVYLPETSKLGRESFDIGGEILIDVEGPDSPETFSGDRIDVGALAEEHFGLAINPYPRKKDASLPSSVKAEDAAEDGLIPPRKLGSLFPKS